MVLFIIILVLLIGALAVLLFSIKPAEKSQCKIVKAGDISKVTKLTATINNLDNKSFVYEREKIDLSKYDIFVVDGESMAKKNIHTGNGLLVSKLYGEEKFRLSGTPLLVFEIDKERKHIRNPHEDIPLFIEYKLREFIGYISNDEGLGVMIQQLSAQDNIDEERKNNIFQKFHKAFDFYDGTTPLIMSYTYPDDQLGYSFHHPRFLVGKVEYIIPKKAIQL
ncbi:hypothetical protein [Bacteroides faecium]|uniref:Uncharacterized protein n=1 Tax=Bacteroides faecium TaxID=2715212 RepID=A0A6H0KTG4_9BACE|nr:hypothetical protein [Bacteroides faecium]QIU96710.1 hypothetical protein BacF7301_22295 [Bacteroides faecium]